MFLDKRVPKKEIKKEVLASLTPVTPPAVLLSQPKVQALLERLRTVYHAQRVMHEEWFEALLSNVVRYVELLPDSFHRYYAQKGGLLEHALFRTELAVSLLQNMMWVNRDKSLSNEQSCWQYAVFSAAMLYGIGKLYLDYQVILYDQTGEKLGAWNPFEQDLVSRAAFYHCEVNFEPQPTLRARLNSVLARQLMPENSMEWLSSVPKVFELWLALLNEDMYGAEMLGAILEYADTQMWAEVLDDVLAKNMLAKSKLRTFETQSSDTTMLAGLMFLHWLKQQLAAGELCLNESPLQMNEDGLILDKEVFKQFARDQPTYKNWEAVQRGFLSLGFNDKSVNTTEVLFSRFGIVLPSKVFLQHPFTKQKTQVSAEEAIYFATKGAKWLPTENAAEVCALPKLNEKGVWHHADVSGVLLKPGQSYHG